MTSSIYPRPVAAVPVAASTDIFTSDITITSDMVSPGGGGTLRLLFSFVFGASPAIISVFNNSILKGQLNANDTFNILDNGYYRFDIDVEAGDIINIQASESVTTVNFVRAHLVQFGA